MESRTRFARSISRSQPRSLYIPYMHIEYLYNIIVFTNNIDQSSVVNKALFQRFTLETKQFIDT